MTLQFSAFLFFAMLAVPSNGERQTCLESPGHKTRPTPEKYLQECTLYAKSSCCHADITEALAHSPVIKINTTFWNRCGRLSKRCEAYMKKIECFYRCSPYAALWSHSQDAAAIYSVPICQRFCDHWYEACKRDVTCVRNWLTDWEIDEKGENHCKNECIPYSEMYANGPDMCESMWGDSLIVSDSSCLCLEMDEMDTKAIWFMEDRSSSSSCSSSSSSSSSSCDEEQFCHYRMKKIKEPEEEEVDDKAWKNNEYSV